MSAIFTRVPYTGLNSRQKENYNFHKVAARLADFGFTSLRLTDDFEGADFVALHVDGVTMLRVQLKSRLTLDRKYMGRGIHVAFRVDDGIFLYPHDEMVSRVRETGALDGTVSWDEAGHYTWPHPPAWAMAILKEYKL